MEAFNTQEPSAAKSKPSSPNKWAKSMGLADDLAAIAGLTTEHLVALAKNGIRSLDDLADLASDELREIVGEQNMTQQRADEVILAARAHWWNGDIV